jgi:omega-6 fatty acid desaturase (delta-12 desaturase)
MAAYAVPKHGRAAWQMVNSLGPLLGLWALMILSELSGWPYAVTLALAVPAAGFMVRTFIIFHDCCHDSFTASPLANRVIGTLTGILTFTSFDDWRFFHRRHHATSGDLDRRGHGDVWMMTVDEYRAAPLRRRLAYRIYRHPLFLFGLGPVYLMFVLQRVPDPRSGRKGMLSILLVDAAIAGMILLATVTIGFWTYVRIQLPVLLLSGALGIWLFFVQHQFVGVRWFRREKWSFYEAALEGSSYYRLPKILQWFSGNIGLHHIHHVRPRVPNYRLQECLDGLPDLPPAREITLRSSLRSLWLNLWDEDKGRLVSFRAARKAA